MKNFLFWTVAIFVTWMPHSGAGLQCHVCSSLEDESCEDLPDDRFLRDCSQVQDRPRPGMNHTLCRKEQFTVSSKELETSSSRVVRSCGYEKHPKFSCFFNSNHDLKESICECTEDGCNHATPSTLAGHSLLLLALITLI